MKGIERENIKKGLKVKIVESKNISFLIVPYLLDLGLKHCFTTIHMDMGTKTNEDLENLTKNFEHIYEFLEINPKILYSGYQVHGNKVEIINSLNQGKEAYFGRYIEDTDGLITNMKGVALISRYADCSPIILFDPINRVQANIHSGWRGTLKEISKVGIESMIKNYKSNVDDIIAIIGPTIGKDDFQVDIDVKTMFQEKFEFNKEIIRKKNHIKYLIDLEKTNKRILLESGIKEKNIICMNLSTYSNPLLHSYRRDKGKYGLMGLVTMIE